MNKIFYFLCLSFIMGIALASFLNNKYLTGELYWFGGIMMCLILVVIFWKNYQFKFIALLGLFLFLGIWRYAIFLPNNIINKIWYYNSSQQEFSGQIISEVDRRVNSQKLLLGKIKINDSQGIINKKLEGKVLITLNLYPKYKYGDELKISCQLETPIPFNGFAYDRYLARHDIYSLCYYPKIDIISSNHGNIFYKLIYKFKDYARVQFDKNLNSPYSFLAKAMLIGDKQGIPNELRIQFSRSGISHVIAISGMHIGIITAIVLVIINQLGLGRRTSYVLANTFLFLFIIMIGLPASAIRAGIMGFLVLTALYLGRLNQLKYSLVVVAAMLLLVNPFLLRDDIGWQLSFLAVFGIAYFYPLFDAGFKKIISQKIIKFKIVKNILAIINITLAANIAVWPIVVYNFNVISFISPLSNLLILWTLPFLFVFLVFGLVFVFLPGLSFLIFRLAELILFYIIKISELLVALPYTYREVYIFDWRLIIIYYLILAYILFIIKKK